MKVLVLGGTLFLGRAVVARFGETHDVTVFHRGLHPLGLVAGVQEFLGDRCRKDDVACLFRRDWDVVLDVGYIGVESVRLSVARARDRAGRYILISSSSVYRDRGPLPASEDAPIVSFGSSDYVNAKLEAERAVAELFEGGIIIRLSKLYGEDNPIYRERYYADRILAGRPILLASDPVLHFTYVTDAAEGILRLACSAGAKDRFNLAGPEPARLSEFVSQLATVLGRSTNVSYDPASQAPWSAEESLVLDCGRLERICGWKPRVGLRKGLSLTFGAAERVRDVRT